jgi:ParB family chromosome partitioning protein
MAPQSGEERFFKGKLYNLDINRLEPDPEQPRKHFDEVALTELAESIKQHGVLQPVLFRKDESGKLYIVAGERRFRAAKEAGLNEIPAIFTKGMTAEISLIENLLRENLTAVEEAEALQAIIEKHGYKQDDLAKTLGKAPSTVSEILSLNKLPQEIRDECRQDPKCPRRVLLEIVRKKKYAKGMITLFEKYKEKGLTSDELRKRTRSKAQGQTSKEVMASVNGTMKKLSGVNWAEWDESDRNQLSEKLGELKRLIDEKLSTAST